MEGVGIDDNAYATEDNGCGYIKDESLMGWFL